MAAELPPFDVEIVAHGDAMLLRLSGELDYGTVPALQGALAEVARRHPEAPVRVDLRPLDFIDSAGISALIGANSEAHRRGVPFQIVRGSEKVQRPLQVVGMEQLVEFVDG